MVEKKHIFTAKNLFGSYNHTAVRCPAQMPRDPILKGLPLSLDLNKQSDAASQCASQKMAMTSRSTTWKVTRGIWMQLRRKFTTNFPERRVLIILANIAIEEKVKGLVESVVKEFGKLNVVSYHPLISDSFSQSLPRMTGCSSLPHAFIRKAGNRHTLSLIFLLSSSSFLTRYVS
jgi:hypothetical protein